MKQVYLGIDINNREVGYTVVARAVAELAKKHDIEIVNLHFLHPDVIVKDFWEQPLPSIAKRMYAEWVSMSTRADGGLFLLRHPSIGCGIEMALLKSAGKPVAALALPAMFFNTSIHAIADEVHYWETGGLEEVEHALVSLAQRIKQKRQQKGK